MNSKYLTWEDVFDARKLFPLDYNACREKIMSVGYRYMCFNGQIWDLHTQEIICLKEELWQ